MTSHHAANWLDTLAARGRAHFVTTDAVEQGRAHFVTTDAVEQLGISIPAAHATLARLLRKGRIASPYRGFYVIVPPEYRSLGCLPAEQFVDQLMTWLQFVDQLMTWLREPYHVGLLTAAAYHGAAHQRPQRTQVIVARSRRRIRCGSVQVDFITRHDMSSTPTQIHNTRAGHLLVSTPEATALEPATSWSLLLKRRRSRSSAMRTAAAASAMSRPSWSSLERPCSQDPWPTRQWDARSRGCSAWGGCSSRSSTARSRLRCYPKWEIGRRRPHR
ncbi:MAG: type IV toxin-antitoxin system AbiEi family antitoxin domain-containing protein [Deltaproteobacteria bacterium]|nr:type IV toxin-antitoxin system AbiEi family antitoxin domain-containing protein [Deltaproteobacteria bacterium]